LWPFYSVAPSLQKLNKLESRPGSAPGKVSIYCGPVVDLERRLYSHTQKVVFVPDDKRPGLNRSATAKETPQIAVFGVLADLAEKCHLCALDRCKRDFLTVQDREGDPVAIVHNNSFHNAKI
jgi:hypothetical protein